MSVPELLRRRVVGSAHAGAFAGQRAVADLVLEEAGQPQIEQLDAPIGREQQVGRLDVAVDQAVLMGVLKRQRRLVGVVRGAAG